MLLRTLLMIILLGSFLIGQTKDSIAVEQKPTPVGGYKVLMENIEYPETAKKASTEGTVIVKAYVNQLGEVTKTEIIKGIPHTGFDKAACEGILKTRFTPARQNGYTVSTWIAIAIIFGS